MSKIGLNCIQEAIKDQNSVTCRESKEVTFGLDNTGTRFNVDNTIVIELSNGLEIEFNQPATTGWTPQMALWGSEIQTAADNLGLAWVVETRFRWPNDPADLSGGGGFSGPPSEFVSLQLTKMLWRYVNIQIAFGEVTPINAYIKDSSNPIYIGRTLVTDGPVEGQLTRYQVCVECGEEPIWQDENGELLEEGQIPNFWFPCGIISQLPSPQPPVCEYEVTEGCDNLDQVDINNFVSISRYTEICNGEIGSVTFYQEDPNEPNSLIEYQLVGSFVDCATGQIIPEPEPPIVETTIMKLCEENDTKLLLIDSGGNFAEYSFYDQSLTPIAIPVPSAGTGADYENSILYAVTSSNDLLVVDVANRAVISQTPLFTNDGSPLSFSSNSFYNGVLYGQVGANLYQINIATAEVSFFNGPYTGISGSGSSMAINPVDGKFYIMGSAGRVYEVNPAATNPGQRMATLVYDSISGANGATFDENGVLYLGTTVGDENNYGEVYAVPDLNGGGEYTVIGNWPPGVNSLAYYRIPAKLPRCFLRKFGQTSGGNLVYLSDHYISDFSERTVAGAVTCCECPCE